MTKLSAWWRGALFGLIGGVSLWHGGTAQAAAEVKLSKDFIAGIVEKLP
jgi:hypothetical protein